MGKRIVIMAGGTGGHVYPALAVAKELSGQGFQVSWMGTQKGLEARVVPENNIEIDWLTVVGFRGKGLLAKFKVPFLLLKACLQAGKVLHRRKPDVVLGMGGFVAGPGGLMAWVLRIPLVIHEQNRVPGTTNGILAKIASQVLEAFPDSFAKKVKASCTGNPLRVEIANLAQDQTAVQLPLKLLVVGGSLGAQILNEVVPDAVAKAGQIVVKHQTGKAMLAQVIDAYQQQGVTADVTAFIEDMAAAYQWADLIVCRSGAMTISEISAAGLPSILIPFPFAIDDHQTANARYLADAGAGVLIKQAQLNAESLSEKIKQLSENPTTLTGMRMAARSCARLDATTAVANICKQEAGL